ncbi:TOM1-like protein 2 [Bienertia sinuspersici]
MDKSKLASIGERLKAGGSQMGRTISLKVKEMKDLLQAPTPESRIVDQSTSPTLESPDWGLNLRICSLINSEELSGAEIVKAIKKKINNGGNGDAKTMRLALELLEACAMNCEKVFSEIASEKIVEDMVVKLIENPLADRECQVRAMELIRAWAETEELSYLPVFRQTYENLKRRSMSSQVEDGSLPPMHYSLESYVDEHAVSPPESYPVPGSESNGASDVMLPCNYGSLSVEQKKEFLEITRNSLEVLSSLLSSEVEPKVIEPLNTSCTHSQTLKKAMPQLTSIKALSSSPHQKQTRDWDDLTISMLDKCKESQPVIQRIVQSTSDDESLLFEALHLNDELQQVISKFEELHVSKKSNMQQPEEPRESNSADVEDATKSTEIPKSENAKSASADLFNEGVESPKTENGKTAAADLLNEGVKSPKTESSKPAATELHEGVKFPKKECAKSAAADLNDGTESSSEK